MAQYLCEEGEDHSEGLCDVLAVIEVAGLIEYVMKEGLLFEKQPFFHNIKCPNQQF